ITDRRQAQLLETALYRIAEESNSAEDMQQLYAAIHRIIAELMYAKNFYIALYDEETEILTFPYFVDEIDSPPPVQKAGKGLTEYLLKTGQPLLVNPEKVEQLIQEEQIAPKGSPSFDWLGVPLKRGEKTFGILAVQSHSENVRYGSKEKEVLTFVSQHIAGALERKKAQDALRLREARLRFLVEQMPAIFWSTDMNLRITTSMGAGLSRIKMKPDQTVGLNLADVLRGEDVEALVLDAHVKALEGESVAYEYEFRNRDFRVHVEPWRDQNGSIIGTLGLAFDVTEPKKAEEELERSLSLLRATLESTADGILVVDQEGKWISFNKKFVEMWRIPEAIVNSRDEALMLAYVLDQVKDPQEFVAKLKQLYTSYEEESFDVVEFRDGRLFERYSQPQAIAGKSVGRVWSFRNVTERKRAEGLRSALYRIAAQTSIAEDMQEFYAAIHKIVGELMYAKNFYIALYDKTQHILSFPYFVDELDTPPPPKSPAKGLTEYVLAHGEPLLASPEKFTELVDSGDVESVGAPSVDWLGAPLKSADRTFGVLVVQSYTEEVRFGER
ncbi:MAG TPA: GAF domain-containing protein, partial [Acidobacteriota bacterium]